MMTGVLMGEMSKLGCDLNENSMMENVRKHNICINGVLIFHFLFTE
jgi:hypothetical protein